MISLTCGILKSYTNELTNKNRLTYIENKFMITKGERGINYEFGINKYTLLYIKKDKQGPTVQHRKLYLICCNNL